MSNPNRQELDPISNAEAAAPAPVPEARAAKRADAPEIAAALDRLIAEVGGNPSNFEGRLVKDALTTALKLIPDRRDTGELKLMAATLKELRYAFRVFGQYPEPHKVTIFGSARTPKAHPDFAAAIEFSRLMAEAGWMVITGAGGGIMEAGHVGPGREKSFGVAIRLPFETTANEVIAGDSKLIHFRYFFTRKLMFISQAEAVALFPGGFGTLDEAYEALTLVQTGKASMVPIVCVEGPGQNYWEQWDRFVREALLSRGLISPDDIGLYRICHTAAEAVEHILRFYRHYHSSRYVRDDLVLRLKRPLHERDVARLNEQFARLVKSGKMVQRGPLEVEEDNLDLPRLVFTHTRRDFGSIRKLIDAINECDA